MRGKGCHGRGRRGAEKVCSNSFSPLDCALGVNGELKRAHPYEEPAYEVYKLEDV